MKEFYIDGYDVVEQFPDDTPDNVIQETLNKAYPETDDQFVSRIADPATPASAVSFEDFQRYQELKPELSVGDLAGLVAQGAGVVASELMNGVRSTLNLAAQGQLGEMGASLAEGAARGTYDLGNLAMRIGDNLNTYIEPYIQDTGDAKKDQYNRFLAIKEMDSIREAARKGDSTILSRFGISADPASINTEMAEAASYFLDPTVLMSGGSTKVGSFINKALGSVAAKPAELASRATGAAARGLSSLESKVAEKAGQLAKLTEETTGGLGKYALPGGVGALAGSVGLAPAAGVGAGVAMAVPTLEVASGLFKGFANSMGNMPTRIGPLHHLAMSSPQTRAGKMAGRLKFLDPVADYAGRAAGGAVQGAAYGAGLGALAGGMEGAAQGLGAGGVLGAGAGGFSRVAEGLSGVSKRRAEANDYQTWYTQQPREVKDFMDQNVKSEQARVQVMDGWQMFQTALGDEADIRIISDDDFRARFQKDKDKATGAGVQVVEGERPVLYINGQKGNTTTLFHEMFHGIARLDGFDGLVSNISSELGKMYSPAEINQFVKEYEASGIALKGREGLVTTDDKFSAIMEELGAEHFANFIQGKDSSYLLKGSPLKDALSGFVNRFVAGKLDRIYDTFESPIFKSHLKRNRALDRAMNDLVKARRKAYKQVELSADDYIRAYGENDLGDDNVFNELQALGVAELDNKGKRIIKSNYRIGKETKELGKQLKDALAGVNDAGGMLKQSDGSYKGRNFSPDQLRALLDAPFLSDKVKEVIQFIADIRQSGSDAVNVTYGAATYKNKRGRTKYRNLPISNRDALIYGLTVSPVGTVTANILDLSLLRSKIQRLWSGDSRLHNLFDGPDGMYNDALTYVNALGGDVPTAQVLGSAEKRNHLNKMLGVRNVKGNPELPDTYSLKEADHPWRSFRLDRFVKARKLKDVNAQFSQQAYEMAQGNFSPSKVSPEYDHLRVGTSKLGTKAKPKTTPSTSNISGGRVPREVIIDHLSKMDYDHIPDDIKSISDVDQKREAYIDWMVDNLLALHDAFPSDLRETATLWYDGANQIAKGFSETFGYKPEQAAGVLAVLSPQKNWFMNVAQAEQVMDIWKNHQNTVLTDDLIGKQLSDVVNAASALPSQLKKAKAGESSLAKTRRQNANKKLHKKAQADRMDLLSPMLGKTIGELGNDPRLQAWAIRLLAQSIHGREYRVINPDGTPMQIDTTKSGAPQKNGWGSTDEIKKAVSILQNGTLDNISNNLGSEHKVRNFFNNIIAPNTPFGDATMDTHAVAAAHLMPYGANSKPVTHNFGGGVKGSGVDGISGTYHMYLDAYKKAAQMRDLLPRQMQSITWEAVRLLYPAESRRDKKVVENANSTWKNNSSETARKQIVGGELPAPSWAGTIDGGKPETGSTRLPQEGQATQPGGGLLFRGRGYVDTGQIGQNTRFSPSRASESMPAFNVRNEQGSPFADMIVEGLKSVETRVRPTLNSLVGKRVKLVRTTGQGSGDVIGEVTVGQPKFYATKQEFDADFEKHLVKDNSEFAFGEQGKYGYPMLDPVKYKEPYSVDSVRDRPKGHVITKDMPGPRFSPARTLNKRGGAIYTTEQGHRAVQTSSRAGVRVYDNNGKRIGPVFQSVEKAERYLQGKAK